MPAERPKRIKIRILIIILSGRALDFLSDDIDGSLYETLSNKIATAQTMLESVDPNAWTYEQSAVWAAADAVCDAFDEEGELLISEKDLQDLGDTLAAALANL